MGLLTGVILARIFLRQGNTVDVFADSFRTRHTMEFWNHTVQQLSLSDGDQVVLCCITFDDLHPDRCHKAIGHIYEVTRRQPIIYTHRWPDGYMSSVCNVFVPPFDILEHYANQLQSEEREILRLSLIVSRQADPELLSPADFNLASKLDFRIKNAPHNLWDLLVK